MVKLRMNFQKLNITLKKIVISARCRCSGDTESNKEKVLYFDVSGIVVFDRKTGIQRVVRELLIYLKKNPILDYQVIPVYAPRYSWGFFRVDCDLDKSGALNLKLTNKRVLPKRGDAFFLMDWALGEYLFQLNFLRENKMKGVKVLVVIHDLLPIELPNSFNSRTVKLFKELITGLATFADFICFSSTIATKLKKLLSNLNSRSNVVIARLGTWQGDKESLSYIGRGFYSDLKRTKKIFIMVGTMEPRKNQLYVLKEFEKLWKHGFDGKLVVIGRPGWKCQNVLAEFSSYMRKYENFFYLPKVDDRKLVNLYSSSSALICASLDEGYGLPLIEAASFGLPIICNDKPIFREILGKNAFFFNAKEGKLEEAIKHWLKLPFDEIPKSSEVQLYEWKDTTYDLLNFLEKDG